MPILSKPSGAARTAVAYITIGALIDVWTAIYWIYLDRHPEGHSDAAHYWVYGFFFTGLVLLVIGLAVGRIGREARHAELPPELPPGTPEPAVPVVAQYPTTPVAPVQYSVGGQTAGAPVAPVATTIPNQAPNVLLRN